jgi:hypothetical protein
VIQILTSLTFSETTSRKIFKPLSTSSLYPLSLSKQLAHFARGCSHVRRYLRFHNWYLRMRFRLRKRRVRVGLSLKATPWQGLRELSYERKIIDEEPIDFLLDLDQIAWLLDSDHMRYQDHFIRLGTLAASGYLNLCHKSNEVAKAHQPILWRGAYIFTSALPILTRILNPVVQYMKGGDGLPRSRCSVTCASRSRVLCSWWSFSILEWCACRIFQQP